MFQVCFLQWFNHRKPPQGHQQSGDRHTFTFTSGAWLAILPPTPKRNVSKNSNQTLIRNVSLFVTPLHNCSPPIDVYRPKEEPLAFCKVAIIISGSLTVVRSSQSRTKPTVPGALLEGATPCFLASHQCCMETNKEPKIHCDNGCVENIARELTSSFMAPFPSWSSSTWSWLRLGGQCLCSPGVSFPSAGSTAWLLGGRLGSCSDKLAWFA